MNSIISSKSLCLSGEIKVPGDKSISHRALIIGSIVNGKIKIRNLLESEDVLATANALKKLDIKITTVSNDEWEIECSAPQYLDQSSTAIKYAHNARV